MRCLFTMKKHTTVTITKKMISRALESKEAIHRARARCAEILNARAVSPTAVTCGYEPCDGGPCEHPKEHAAREARHHARERAASKAGAK